MALPALKTTHRHALRKAMIEIDGPCRLREQSGLRYVMISGFVSMRLHCA